MTKGLEHKERMSDGADPNDIAWVNGPEPFFDVMHGQKYLNRIAILADQRGIPLDEMLEILKTEPIKVYVAVEDVIEDRIIRGVFLTKEEAENCKGSMYSNGCYAEECTLGEAIDFEARDRERNLKERERLDAWTAAHPYSPHYDPRRFEADGTPKPAEKRQRISHEAWCHCSECEGRSPAGRVI